MFCVCVSGATDSEFTETGFFSLVFVWHLYFLYFAAFEKGAKLYSSRPCFRLDETFALQVLPHPHHWSSHKSRCQPPPRNVPLPLTCHPPTPCARRWWQWRHLGLRSQIFRCFCLIFWCHVDSVAVMVWKWAMLCWQGKVTLSTTAMMTAMLAEASRPKLLCLLLWWVGHHASKTHVLWPCFLSEIDVFNVKTGSKSHLLLQIKSVVFVLELRNTCNWPESTPWCCGMCDSPNVYKIDEQRLDLWSIKMFTCCLENTGFVFWSGSSGLNSESFSLVGRSNLIYKFLQTDPSTF